MKFKKIEISAFRIYNNPENAVFDFRSNSGDIADFVSLYAPNGFGKTSFYDAVEWGVTGSVNRFFIRNNELSKLEINQSVQNKIPLLRNSKLERDTYVKVFSNSSDEPLEKTISKNSTASDLLLKRNAVSHEFQKVILSQEWISAFLTENKGEDRYRKFMEMPELSGINDYYLNLKHLLSFQTAEERRIQDEIKDLNKQIKKLDDQNLLETINLRIKNINTACDEKKFNPIRIDTTSAELVVFKDLITINQTHYENETQSLTNIIENLRIALTGSNELPSLMSFGDIKVSFPKLLKEIDTVKQLLTKFEEKEKITNEQNKLQQSLAEISSKKGDVEILLAKFNQFETTNANITIKTDALNKLQKSLPEFNGVINNLKREEISLNERLKSCLEEIDINEGKKKALPALEAEISAVTKGICETNKELETQTLKIEPLEKSIKAKREKSSEFETLRNQLQEGEYSKKYLEENTELFELIDVLNQSLTALSLEKSKIGILNKKIEKQQDLNSAIQSFIEQGLAIVNENQSSKCPLCEHQYPDLITLADKISKNNALNDVLKDFISQKQALTEYIRNIEETINNGNDKLSEYYTGEINKIATEILVDSEAIESIKKLIQEGNDKLKNLRIKNAQLSASMLGLTFEEYKIKLDGLINTGLKSKETITESLTGFDDDLKEKQEFLKKQNGEITIIQKEIGELQKNTDYLAVIDFFKVNHPTENINKGFVDNLLDNYKKDISTITEKKKANVDLLDILNEKLNMYTKENLKIQESELELKKGAYENVRNKYVLFFKDSFNHDIYDLDIEDIDKFIKNEKIKNTQSFEKYKSIYDELTALKGNSQDIAEFLQTENIKLEIQSKETEYSFLKSFVRPEIEREREKAKKFIEHRITNFLHETLIDTLYNKIDPHPDFKKVRFTPNLDADPPRLDVFVGNKDSELIIPNLYFSTAQINILSLCIFLASALKSKEYDCIFVDDPIQSMDSINVLSTIDLLRSIVVNNGKQIIISTHDLNFHNLLKKKMPPELFKSKFLKLESFGKVVSE